MRSWEKNLQLKTDVHGALLRMYRAFAGNYRRQFGDLIESANYNRKEFELDFYLRLVNMEPNGFLFRGLTEESTKDNAVVAVRIVDCDMKNDYLTDGASKTPGKKLFSIGPASRSRSKEYLTAIDKATQLIIAPDDDPLVIPFYDSDLFLKGLENRMSFTRSPEYLWHLFKPKNTKLSVASSNASA